MLKEARKICKRKAGRSHDDGKGRSKSGENTGRAKIAVRKIVRQGGKTNKKERKKRKKARAECATFYCAMSMKMLERRVRTEEDGEKMCSKTHRNEERAVRERGRDRKERAKE